MYVSVCSTFVINKLLSLLLLLLKNIIILWFMVYEFIAHEATDLRSKVALVADS